MHKLLLLLFTFCFPVLLAAGGGMWLPLLLENLNEEEMKGMGMKITADDIYSINQGSLKDAIVHFGGFCTGEVISNQGLLLTNHHCGFSAIQSHSSLEDNLLEDGFYARTKAEEKPNAGLFVTFIERIEDVTKRILDDVEDDLSEADR
ncbi:MAG: S46 family peptidase, partial [Lewinella sp.]